MSLFGSELLIRTSFLGKIPLLTKATSDDNDPTAGHLLNEINKLTYDNEIVCQDIILWLNGRLKLNSCSVKLKTLKIMKHLVLKGHVNFKKILRKQSNEVSEACKFGGILKSLDESLRCSQVRKEANELLEMLYAFHCDDKDEEKSNTQLPQALIGMGPFSSNKMVGFGSSVKCKESLSNTILQSVSDFAVKVSELNFSSKIDFYETSGTRLMNSDACNSDINNKKGQKAEEYCTDNSGRPGDKFIEGDDEINNEKGIIHQFVQDSKKSIFKANQKFTQNCGQADISKLIQVLADGLEENNQDLIEYLVIIETMHRYGVVNSEDLYKNLFSKLSPLCQNSRNSAVKLKSRKILLTLKHLPQSNQISLDQLPSNSKWRL